ncbi:MAG: L,D-transpeptidase family protein [Phycisphaerae bacterium]|jgi:LysM repeat protein
MALSGYNPNRQKVVIYYFAVALIIIAAIAILYFYSPGKNKKTNENILSDAGTTQQTSQAQNTGTGKTIADVNLNANPRIAAMLRDAQNCIAGGKIIVARNTLNDILNMSLDATTRDVVKKQLSDLAQEWLFSRTIQLGDDLCSSYKVQSGDSLAQIGARYKVPYKLLMKLNNIASDKSLRADQVIKVVHGPFHAIVYSSAFTMDLYLQNVYVKSYKIGIGKEGHETPVGLWKAEVGGKMVKPTWTDPDTGKTYHADDADYPLGSGWIALEGIDNRTRGIEGIAIHGTNDETTIGTKSSRGCIRLYNGELIEVYDMLEAGYSELRVVE